MDALWFGIINALLFVADVAAGAFSGQGKLGPYSVGYWSNVYTDKITPPSWMFIVAWASIYALLALFIISFYWSKRPDDFPLTKISIFLGVSSILNGGWLVAWTFGQLVVSVFVMAALLVIVQLIDVELSKHREGVKIIFYYIWRSTFGVYSAWLTLAAILNVTCICLAHKVSFAASEMWSCIWLIVAGIYSIIFFSIYMKNGASSIMVAFVYCTIASRYASSKLIMAISIVFAVIIMAVWAVVQFYQRRQGSVTTPLVDQEAEDVDKKK